MKLLLTIAAVMVTSGTFAQSLIPGLEIGGTGRLMPYDSAVLDLRETRSDLPCTITSRKPELGLDFMFHTGYSVSIPVRELAGSGNLLTVVFRVYPEKHFNKATYFVQKMPVPAIGQDAQGRVALEGSFLVGKGGYLVDWLVRDSDERVCAGFWMLEPKVGSKDGAVAGAVPHDTVLPADANPFAQPSPVATEQRGGPLNVKIIVNFAPQNIERATPSSADVEGLAAILRTIGREPRVSKYTIVACSVAAQQVFYRQQDAPHLNLSALGQAFNALALGKVDVKQLAVKNGEIEFLTNLILNEVKNDRFDGLIFVGPKYPLDANVSPGVIAQLKENDLPVFYLTYESDPLLFPWRDAIGHVVKQLRGFQYSISRPCDLLNAWSDVLSRIIKRKETLGVQSAN